jgi:hypothetical protein
VRGGLAVEGANWLAIVAGLEEEMRSSKGSRIKAHDIKSRVGEALRTAEAGLADSEVIDRLDHLLILSTEAARVDVCNNTKCPHYNKNCKMR